MTFVRRRMTVRVTAAIVAPGLLAAGTVAAAGPASAEDARPGPGGAAATLDGLRTADEALVHRGGEEQRTGAGLFEMAVDDGGSLQTYSVDIDNPTQSQAGYEEAPWSASSLHDNRNAGKIRWILQHSYPQVNDLSALARKAGAETLSPETAAAGTQVAIWRFSDHVKVSAVDPGAEKLADHLQKAARPAGEPEASLSVDRSAVSGRSGGLIGPVTVRTGVSGVAVAATPDAPGAQVVDENGERVTEARDGSKLYLRTPRGSEAGAGSLTLQASMKVPVGRVLTGTGARAQSQTHVVAGSSQSTVSATLSASWAASGAIPAVTVGKNCAKNGIDVHATNAGDTAYRFTLNGEKHRIEPRDGRTVTVPVEEDQPYRIPVPGPGGAPRAYTGVLDCATASAAAASGASEDIRGVAPQGGHAPSGGSVSGAGDDDTAGSSTDLAETGSSNTGQIIGIAVALVVLGAVALLVVRRGTPGPATGSGTAGDAAEPGPEASSERPAE